ncbi:ArsR/SmtB family transcription factor [Nibricoccus sp. IMCC34717]|uniref:ArsR/SmtB family transcription factor n=1 Tax=Nibricoccus sp. IMCC34717 TaxID=3034021 RepID=UPI00384E23A4
MSRKPSLPPKAIEQIARRFGVLSEPMRLRLLQALFDGERNVTELVEATGGTQANVSRHLQTLLHAHIVSRRRQGLQVFYTIADPSIFKLCELVCGSIEKAHARQAEAFD